MIQYRKAKAEEDRCKDSQNSTSSTRTLAINNSPKPKKLVPRLGNDEEEIDSEVKQKENDKNSAVESSD